MPIFEEILKSIQMMSTATNNEFYERQSIGEFLGEHEVVMALYAVAQRGFVRSMNRTRQLLEIFNVAYFVCMRLTDGSGRTFDEALNECPYAWREMDSRAYRNHLFALIYSLLRVHQGLLPIRAVDMDCSRNRVDYYFSWSRYEEVISKYVGKLTRPLNFSGRSTVVTYHFRSTTVPVEKLNESDPMPLLERAASDIAKAGERMKTQLAEKDKRIKELADQVKEEQAKVQVKEARIKELEEQNTSLSNNPFCLDKIKAYAKGLDKDEAKVITHMLLTIALEEQLPKARQAEVREAVKEVEAAHRKQVGGQSVYIEHQEIHNDNQQSQVFNGSITDSKFGK